MNDFFENQSTVSAETVERTEEKFASEMAWVMPQDKFAAHRVFIGNGREEDLSPM